MRLKNKTALIIGCGNRTKGNAIVQRFLKEGAKIIVFDIKNPNLKVEFFQVDINKEDEIINAIKKIKKLDVVVNTSEFFFQSSIENTTKKQLDDVINETYRGMYLICKHTLQTLKKSKGNIINISSALGIVPEPKASAFCFVQAAVIMLTKCIAQEYASKGVRINAVLCGPTGSPVLEKALPSKIQRDEYVKFTPMKRLALPSEIANVAVFLASDEASYVTGGLYSVDGGESTSSLYSK